jgi:chemotaxis protein CheD
MAMASPNPHQLDVARGPCKVTRNAPALGEHQRAFLLPGQLHASAEPFQVRTILGSCVSICLWDKRQRAGGMNHFLLPASREGEPASLRFADVATQTLLEKLRALGCRPPNLRAKIFGGSSMFRNQNRYATSLGARNVAVALELMKSAGIPVSVQDTGGTQGRKIVFNTDDGVAWSQRI